MDEATPANDTPGSVSVAAAAAAAESEMEATVSTPSVH